MTIRNVSHLYERTGFDDDGNGLPYRMVVRDIKGGPMKWKMALYDSERNSYSGEIDSKGGISLYGDDGQYLYGVIGSKGSVTLYDENNNLISGDVDKNGKVFLYDDAGNQWYGKIKTSQ